MDALVRIVGVDHVLVDADVVSGYTRDWSGRFGGPCLAVVRPATSEQVAQIVKWCAETATPLIVQGGNTGLVGGGVPGAVVDDRLPLIMSTRRLSAIGPVDELSGQLTAQAGAVLADVQRAASGAGWYYGVDLAARDSATIGGTVATNAGGIRVCAFGMTRAQVVGVQAVLPDGTVIDHLAGLRKDNTGYDLGGLLVGSEGTLAVLTAVRLQLHRPAGRSTLALVGVPSIAAAQDKLANAVRPGVRLLAAELIDAVGMRLVRAISGLPAPLAADHPSFLLIEVQDGGTAEGFCFETDDDVVVATDSADTQRLWSYRERLSEAFSSMGVIHKLDVSVPLADLAYCANELAVALGTRHDVTEFGVFGHLADGNLHVEVAGPAPDDETVTRTVLTIVSSHGGSISAEHGIGRAKAPYLSLSRGPSEIAAMRAIKHSLDPQGLFNPGVVLQEEE